MARSTLISSMILISIALSTSVSAVQITQLAYGPDDAQVLDLYTPDKPPADAMATVVLAHGGLWQGGNRSTLASLCTNIVTHSNGSIACASIDYRLSQDLGGSCAGTGKQTYTEQIGDMALAYALLQSKADRYGLNPKRMHVGGHSAGGHLAHTFNLRWDEFAQQCSHPDGCPAALGAIGLEGIYDIPAWNQYDLSFWKGRFACTTRKAFGAPGPSPSACIETERNERCWDSGSPMHLTKNAKSTGDAPVGDALLIHSPGDNWVDIAEAENFSKALTTAFPGITVVTETSGRCATGQHDETLSETALAECIVAFVAARFPADND